MAIIKIFDDLEPFETRFSGTFSFDAERNGLSYNGCGQIYDDRILYSVRFFRERIDKSTYSTTLTHIHGYLDFEGEKYKLTDVFFDKKEDEFLFTFTNGDKTIKLDCEITDFKFRCEYLNH